MLIIEVDDINAVTVLPSHERECFLIKTCKQTEIPVCFNLIFNRVSIVDSHDFPIFDQDQLAILSSCKDLIARILEQRHDDLARKVDCFLDVLGAEETVRLLRELVIFSIEKEPAYPTLSLKLSTSVLVAKSTWFRACVFSQSEKVTKTILIEVRHAYVNAFTVEFYLEVGASADFKCFAHDQHGVFSYEESLVTL